MRGLFISLEGGEGAGKSTLMHGLAERLRARGHRVVTTREPGGTPGAEAIRDMLVTGTTDRWNPTTEALLFYAARVDHVDRVIKPALADGSIVLCDRFADSTMAYQGAAGGVDIEKLRQLHDLVLDGFWPDLTLVVDLEPEVGLQRTLFRGGDETRFESHEREFHQRLRQHFLDIAQREPGRCCVLDGQKTAETVCEDAFSLIQQKMAGLAA